MDDECVFCGGEEWVILCGRPLCEECCDTFKEMMSRIVEAQKIDKLFEKFEEEI